MLSILASGTLVSDPRQRTTAAGKPYAIASLLKIPTPCWQFVIAFAADAVAALLALQRGDSVAIAGRAKLTSWEKDGEQKHGLSVVANKVLTIYQVDKKRRQARGEAQDESAEATT